MTFLHRPSGEWLGSPGPGIRPLRLRAARFSGCFILVSEAGDAEMGAFPVWESGFEEGRCRCTGAGPGRRHGGLWTRSRYADDRVGFYGATVGEAQFHRPVGVTAARVQPQRMAGEELTRLALKARTCEPATAQSSRPRTHWCRRKRRARGAGRVSALESSVSSWSGNGIPAAW